MNIGFKVFLLGCFLISNNALALVKEDEPFDPRQIPVELHGWWAPNFGHIHAGLRLPLGQKVSGTMDLNVRIVLHNNPGHLFRLRISAESSPSFSKKLNLSCPYDGVTNSTCAFNVPFSVDTTKMRDGWRELRVAAYASTPDKKVLFNSSGIPIYVDNGKPDRNYNRYCNNTSLIGRGWYTGFGYTNAIIECVPLKPISGIHTFRVRAQNASERLRVGLDTTHHIPAVGPYPEQQPNPSGRTLFDGMGNFQKWVPIEVDTRLLMNGWHTLSVASFGPKGSTSDCSYCKGEINKPTGIAKIWFFVEN